MGHSRTGRRAVNQALIRIEALKLRLTGMAYKDMAEKLDCSIGSAYNAVSKALAELDELAKEKAEEVRQMELARIDSVLDAVMEKARKGNDKAIASMLKLMDRRAKYLGLDSPVQIEDIVEKERVIIELADKLEVSVEEARKEYDKTKSGYVKT